MDALDFLDDYYGTSAEEPEGVHVTLKFSESDLTALKDAVDPSSEYGIDLYEQCISNFSPVVT